MTQFIKDMVFTLFTSDGALLRVRGLLALGSVGTVCGLAAAGQDIPEALTAITAGVVGFYFRDRVK